VRRTASEKMEIIRSGGIQMLGHGDQSPAGSAALVDAIENVACGAGKPIELQHNDAIGGASTNLFQRTSQTRALRREYLPANTAFNFDPHEFEIVSGRIGFDPLPLSLEAHPRP
jgi:hypothetical protein